MTLTIVGAVVLAYAATVLLWRDPLTDVYARYQQRQLSADLEQQFTAYRQDSAPVRSVPEEALPDPAAVVAAARRFARGVERGEPVGRLRIPRLGMDKVFVHGTRWGADLSRGPGHYERTSLPGLRRVVAIAGHRTTFGAPFRHIDDMRQGDNVVVTMPYGTFRYRVVGHEVVDDEDWSIIRPRRFETLVLSACHPLYSAAQRWVVYARLREVVPSGGRSYVVAAGWPAAAPS